jgi:hypothetical protein
MDPTPLPPGKPRVESPHAPVVNPSHYCPRCGGLLKFPETIGACMVCGYSRVQPVGGRVSPQTLTPGLRPGSTSETLETFRWMSKLPGWFWVLLMGSVVIIGGGILANWWLPHTASGGAHPRLTARTMISTITLALAIPGILITQVWVLFCVALKDARVEFLDAINPIRAWGLAISRLPATRHPLCSACWCWSAVLTALFLVGGMDYWMPSKHKSFRIKTKEFVKAIIGLRLDEDSDDEELDESEPLPPPPKEVDPDSRPTLTCTIIGYLTNPEEGGLNGILVAIKKEDGKLQYAGIVQAGLSGKKAEWIRDKLSRYVTSKRPLEGVEVENAIWVKPVLTCTIHQAGVAASGLLLEPSFGELVEKKKRS